MNKDILFNPSFEKYKYPVGAVRVNESFSLNLYINKNFNIYDLKLVIYNDNGEVDRKDLYYGLSDENYNIYKFYFLYHNQVLELRNLD